jgi:hypothetical protein
MQSKKQVISGLIYEARQRSEDLDESTDLIQDRSHWAAYVHQQLGEGSELSRFEADNDDGTLNTIDDPGDRLTFAKNLYTKDAQRLADIRRNLAG